MPTLTAATDPVSGSARSRRCCLRGRSSASASATKPPVIDAVRVPPSACSTSQSIRTDALAERRDVDDRAQAAADQSLDLVRAPAGPPPLALDALAASARQHPVLGGDPAASPARAGRAGRSPGPWPCRSPASRPSRSAPSPRRRAESPARQSRRPQRPVRRARRRDAPRRRSRSTHLRHTDRYYAVKRALRACGRRIARRFAWTAMSSPRAYVTKRDDACASQPRDRRRHRPTSRSTSSASTRSSQKIASLIRRSRVTDATVLILGESGTGKELVARAIHAAEPRARTGRSSRSTAARSPPSCSSPRCSATSAAPSPAPIGPRAGHVPARQRRHHLPRRGRRDEPRRCR